MSISPSQTLATPHSPVDLYSIHAREFSRDGLRTPRHSPVFLSPAVGAVRFGSELIGAYRAVPN